MKIAFIGCAGNKLPANRIILSCYCYCAQIEIAGIKFGERKLLIHNITNVSKQKRKTTFLKQRERQREREREADRKKDRDRQTGRQADRKTKRQRDR